MLHGVSRQWNADGKLVADRSFENGCELGKVTEFHKPGVKRLEYGILKGKVEPLTLDDPWNVQFATEEKIGSDLRHGPVTAWYSNGQIRFQGNFNRDVQQGNFAWYYPTGQRQALGKMQNGQRVEYWTWWHDNGMRASVGSYDKGVPMGRWQWWQADGKLASNRDFEPTVDSDKGTTPAKNVSLGSAKGDTP